MYEVEESTEITEFDINPEQVFSDEIAEEAWEWVNEHDDLGL